MDGALYSKLQNAGGQNNLRNICILAHVDHGNEKKILIRNLIDF